MVLMRTGCFCVKAVNPQQFVVFFYPQNVHKKQLLLFLKCDSDITDPG